MEDLFKDALKKLVNNGVFVVILCLFGYEMMRKQDNMIKMIEKKNTEGNKILLETIHKIAAQRDMFYNQLLNCMEDKVRMEKNHNADERN